MASSTRSARIVSGWKMLLEPRRWYVSCPIISWSRRRRSWSPRAIGRGLPTSIGFSTTYAGPVFSKRRSIAPVSAASRSRHRSKKAHAHGAASHSHHRGDRDGGSSRLWLQRERVSDRHRHHIPDGGRDARDPFEPRRRQRRLPARDGT